MAEHDRHPTSTPSVVLATRRIILRRPPQFAARSQTKHSFEQRDGPRIHNEYRIPCASLDRQGHDPSAEQPVGAV